jgi:hypothetical protein
MSICSAIFASDAVAGTASGAGSIAADSLNFERFRNAKDGGTVLNDPAVKKLIKQTMGNKEQEFWDNTQMVSQPKIEGHHISFSAGVRGLFTIMESIFDLNMATGKVTVGYLKDSTLHIFGVPQGAPLPDMVKSYVTDLKQRDGSVNVSYETADFTPVKTKPVTPAAKKKLNFNTLTGTYERDLGSRFITGQAQVLALPNGKAKIDIAVTNGGHTGELQDTVSLVNNTAICTDAGTKEKVKLQFTGKTVVITGDFDAFSGAGATLLGTYKKTDDAPPKIH